MARLLNKKSLACALGRSASYVSAMCRAGYALKYGTKTDLPHALAWLEANPEFRASHQYLKADRHDETQRPRRQRKDQMAGAVDKPCEPVLTND